MRNWKKFIKNGFFKLIIINKKYIVDKNNNNKMINWLKRRVLIIF